jgi:hypothetical protein
MRVLIVAKTHVVRSACVGGLDLDTNRGVRLLQPNGGYQPGTTDFEVGQIWEIECEPGRDLRPPHLEDVLVHRREFLGREKELRKVLLERVTPWRGAPNRTFEGLVRPTFHGSGYVNDIMGVPTVSTGFWQPDQRLTLSMEETGPHYHYPMPPKSRGVHNLKYVGYAPPVEVIPTGTLVRVSLARWWRPDGASTEVEERCYMQLSGWYL